MAVVKITDVNVGVGHESPVNASVRFNVQQLLHIHDEKNRICSDVDSAHYACLSDEKPLLPTATLTHPESCLEADGSGQLLLTSGSLRYVDMPDLVQTSTLSVASSCDPHTSRWTHFPPFDCYPGHSFKLLISGNLPQFQ